MEQNFDHLLKKISVLGSGSFGEVWLVEVTNDFYVGRKFVKKGDHYAYKIYFDISEDGGSIENGTIDGSIIREFNCMNKFNHPNIVSSIGLNYDENCSKLGILMEIAVGTLENHIISHQSSLNELKKIMFELLGGLEYLHSNYIIHNDIKPENILFFEKESKFKIADFGASELHCGNKTTTPTTLIWQAPEVFLGANLHSFETDVWSLGLIFFELVYKKPWILRNFESCEIFAQNKITLIKQMQQFILATIKEFQNPEYENINNLIFELLNFDSENRITTKDALNHKVFYGMVCETYLEKSSCPTSFLSSEVVNVVEDKINDIFANNKKKLETFSITNMITITINIMNHYMTKIDYFEFDKMIMLCSLSLTFKLFGFSSDFVINDDDKDKVLSVAKLEYDVCKKLRWNLF